MSAKKSKLNSNDLLTKKIHKPYVMIFDHLKWGLSKSETGINVKSEIFL